MTLKTPSQLISTFRPTLHVWSSSDGSNLRKIMQLFCGRWPQYRTPIFSSSGTVSYGRTSKSWPEHSELQTELLSSDAERMLLKSLRHRIYIFTRRRSMALELQPVKPWPQGCRSSPAMCPGLQTSFGEPESCSPQATMQHLHVKFESCWLLLNDDAR